MLKKFYLVIQRIVHYRHYHSVSPKAAVVFLAPLRLTSLSTFASKYSLEKLM
jgi:hypothetical protein